MSNINTLFNSFDGQTDGEHGLTSIYTYEYKNDGIDDTRIYLIRLNEINWGELKKKKKQNGKMDNSHLFFRLVNSHTLHIHIYCLCGFDKYSMNKIKL